MKSEERQVERLIYVRPGGGRFVLGRGPLEVIRRYVQDAADLPEGGGVLLGRHILGSDDVVVDHVTVPMHGDRRSRSRFFRARRGHQDLIDRAWAESGGTRTYLGEWHTHPQGVPIPSPIDRRNWRRKLKADRFSGFLFFVIVGTEELRVWEGHCRNRVYPLEVLP